jgi:hypothetical protein
MSKSIRLVVKNIFNMQYMFHFFHWVWSIYFIFLCICLKLFCLSKYLAIWTISMSAVGLWNFVMLVSGLENRDYGCGDPLRWLRNTLYQLKLALTSPTGCDRSVGIVCLRTETTFFFFFLTVGVVDKLISALFAIFISVHVLHISLFIISFAIDLRTKCPLFSSFNQNWNVLTNCIKLPGTKFHENLISNF